MLSTQLIHNQTLSEAYSAHTEAARGPVISFNYGIIRFSAKIAEGNTYYNLSIREQKELQDCADKIEQFCAKKYSLSSLPAEQQKESQIMLSTSTLILDRRAALKILSNDTSSTNIQDLIMRQTSTRFRSECGEKLDESRYFDFTEDGAVIKENIKKHISTFENRCIFF